MQEFRVDSGQVTLLQHYNDKDRIRKVSAMSCGAFAALAENTGEFLCGLRLCLCCVHSHSLLWILETGIVRAISNGQVNNYLKFRDSSGKLLEKRAASKGNFMSFYTVCWLLVEPISCGLAVATAIGFGGTEKWLWVGMCDGALFAYKVNPSPETSAYAAHIPPMYVPECDVDLPVVAPQPVMETEDERFRREFKTAHPKFTIVQQEMDGNCLFRSLA